MLGTAIRLSATITPEDVIYANTVLSYAEHFMPKALGEFGKAKHADVAHKVLQVLESNHGVVSAVELWRYVHNDLDKISELSGILENLVRAEKIQSTKGGFLPRHKAIRGVDTTLQNTVTNFNLLSTEEKESLT
jgi:hypothetical protein